MGVWYCLQCELKDVILLHKKGNCQQQKMIQNTHFCIFILIVAGVSGFFLPKLKNPSDAKNTIDEWLVASSYTSYKAPKENNNTIVDEGGDNNSTSIDDEDIDEDVENSLYSDIANIEYDYDEEYYEDTEEDNEPRSIPTDPIGRVVRFVSDVGARFQTELSIISRNFRLALAFLSFAAP